MLQSYCSIFIAYVRQREYVPFSLPSPRPQAWEAGPGDAASLPQHRKDRHGERPGEGQGAMMAVSSLEELLERRWGLEGGDGGDGNAVSGGSAAPGGAAGGCTSVMSSSSRGVISKVPPS